MDKDKRVTSFAHLDIGELFTNQAARFNKTFVKVSCNDAAPCDLTGKLLGPIFAVFATEGLVERVQD